jgi:hypothetical protein
MHRDRSIDDYCADFILRHNLASLRVCGRIFFSDRQRECKFAAFRYFALDPNLAAVHFDEFPR